MANRLGAQPPEATGRTAKVWGLDFVADQLRDRRRFLALTVVDVYTRECLAIEVGQSLKGPDVMRVLQRISEHRGAPQMLFCDNGSEFSSQVMDLRAYHNQVKIDFFRPGKPTDNAHVESLNGTLRAECLDAHWFSNLPKPSNGSRLGDRNIMRVALAELWGRARPTNLQDRSRLAGSVLLNKCRRLTLDLV
jgi:transposase InsO family protein